MKIKKFLVTLFLVASFLIVTNNFAKAQTGNQSDVTGPNPIEIIPFNNQSDITGPNPTEINPFNNQSDVGDLNENVQYKISQIDSEVFQSNLKNALETKDFTLATQLME